MSTNGNKNETNSLYGKGGADSAAKDYAPQEREGIKRAAPQTQHRGLKAVPKTQAAPQRPPVDYAPAQKTPMEDAPVQQSPAYEASAMPAQPQPVDEISEAPEVAPMQKKASLEQPGEQARETDEIQSTAGQVQTNDSSMLDAAKQPTQTTQSVKSTPRRSMKKMREARKQQKLLKKTQREEARKVELFISSMERSLQTVQGALEAIKHWKPLFNLETELFFMPQTLEKFKKYDAQIGDLQHRLEDCSHELEQSQAYNNRLEEQLHVRDSILRQLKQDIAAAQEENRQLVDQLQQKTQQYESMLSATERREQADVAKVEELQKDNAHIRKWIIENAGLEDNEAASQALIREIESFRYAVEALSTIQQICANIEQFKTYEALRLRVNQIMAALALYRKNTEK